MVSLSIVRFDLAQNRGSMVLDGLDGDSEYFRDLLTAVALGDQLTIVCSPLFN